MYKEDYIEKSIQALQDASLIYVRLNCSTQWAASQNNLGVAYLRRKQANLEDNLQKAIMAFSGASQIYHILSNETRASKYKYLEAKFNLGIAYEKSNQLVAAYQAFNITIEASNLNREIIFDSAQVQTEILVSNISTQVKKNNDNQDLIILATNISNNAVGFIQTPISSEKESKEKLRELNNQLYQAMVRVCIKIEKYAEAIEYVERSKTRMLLEMQAIRELKYQNQDLKSSSDDLRRIQKEYEVESRKVAESDNPNHEKCKNLLREFITKYPYKTLNFGEIQELAATDSAILEWYLLNDKFLTFCITEDPPLTPPSKGGGQDSNPPFQGEEQDSTPPFLRGAGGIKVSPSTPQDQEDSTPPFLRGAGQGGFIKEEQRVHQSG